MIKKKQKKKTYKKEKVKDYVAEISQMQSDVKTFIENFKKDVERKKKEYQSYIQKSQNKNPLIKR